MKKSATAVSIFVPKTKDEMIPPGSQLMFQVSFLFANIICVAIAISLMKAGYVGGFISGVVVMSIMRR